LRTQGQGRDVDLLKICNDWCTKLSHESFNIIGEDFDIIDVLLALLMAEALELQSPRIRLSHYLKPVLGKPQTEDATIKGIDEAQHLHPVN